MIRVCPLASGSKGNALFIEVHNTRILIDAGIGVRTLEARLNALHTSLSEIDAILVTHEHSDHVSGLDTILNRFPIPVIANCETAKAIAADLNYCPKFKLFTTGEPFHFQDLYITPFSIQHDTFDPVAFTIETPDHKIGVCTDLGFPTSLVQHHLQECTLLFLESNHEPDMVMACSRPETYKQRVLSRSGHLSNQESADLIAKVLSPKLTQIYLAHLSQECNSPEKALQVLQRTLGNIDIPVRIAVQDTASEVWHG